MKSKKSLFASVILILIILLACQKDIFDPIGPDPIIDGAPNAVLPKIANEFDKMVAGMELPIQSPIEEENVVNLEKEWENDSIRCTTQKVTASPGSEEWSLYNPLSDILWPGSLLRLESLDNGAFTPIVLARKPLIISTSFENISDSTSCRIDNPSLSDARNCISEILAREITGATSANVTFDIRQVHSESQLKVAVGASIGGLWGKVKSSFNLERASSESLFLITFQQIYYAMDIDFPESPSDWFVETPDPSILGSYSPVFVSSIKYGRKVYFMVESSESALAVEAALSASFNAFATRGEINISTAYKNTIERSRTKALIIGGPSSGAIEAVSGVKGLLQYLQEGANYNQDSPGSPIAFTLRFLKNYEIARVVNTTEYTRRICVLDPPGILPIEIWPHDGKSYDYGVDLINGDGEYGGDGNPHVEGYVNLIAQNDQKVFLKIDFTFKENRADYTTGQVLRTHHLFSAPKGYKIKRIITQTNWGPLTYIEPEGDHNPEEFDCNTNQVTQLNPNLDCNGKLVRKVVMNCDTGGEDLPGEFVGEDRSWLQIWFNKIQIELVEVRR